MMDIHNREKFVMSIRLVENDQTDSSLFSIRSEQVRAQSDEFAFFGNFQA